MHFFLGALRVKIKKFMCCFQMNTLTFDQNDHLAFLFQTYKLTRLRSAVGIMSGNRCKPDCRSRGREFDPSMVPYFRGD